MTPQFFQNGNRVTCPMIFDNGVLGGPVLYATGAARSYATIAASGIVANTTTETRSGLVTFPASTLTQYAGIRFRFIHQATATHSTDTLQVKSYFGPATLTTALVAGAAADVANGCFATVCGELFFDAAPGASARITGYAEISGFGTSGAVQTVSRTGIATTIASNGVLLLETSLTWSVADAGNSAQCEKIWIEMI